MGILDNYRAKGWCGKGGFLFLQFQTEGQEKGWEINR